MKIAFTHNVRTSSAVDEAEFDAPETVDAIANALAAGGHEVERVEVSTSPADLASRLDAARADLIFNTAEGRRGRWREAFFPSLFEELGLPYTGSGPHALMLTLDKELTKRVLRDEGVDVARGRVITQVDLEGGNYGAGLAFPVIVKPNFEGSSKGIGDDAVVTSPRELRTVLERCLGDFSEGALVEEFIPGMDVTVPFLAAVKPDGVLAPVEYLIDPTYQRKYDIYDYRLKNELSHLVSVRCPAEIPRDVAGRMRTIARLCIRTLRLRDVTRLDFRIGNDGRIYFLEANALPSLEQGASIFAAAALNGLDYTAVINAIVESAARRYGILLPQKRPAKKPSIRVGFTFNLKRQPPTSESDDHEAEYDPPTTIQAVHKALEELGHTVVPLEATPELPRRLVDEQVDVVFNIAEGIGTGRGREAQVPALCELAGIPCTGSDASALALALDKALTKRILKQHDVPTPDFQILQTGKEKMRALRYPVIVKPNAEGSSKGIGDKNVCDNEADARAAAAEIIGRYRQPALVEEYISGREFTVGLLGGRRPRVLPPMEIVFTNPNDTRPVYDFAIKQEWDKHVAYKCPPDGITPAQQRQMEKLARETFTALGCRDVARVDMRMTAAGELFVLEINPLPGLTPDFSDLVIIGKAVGIDYRSLVSEILSGALVRLRETRRRAQAPHQVAHTGGGPSTATKPA